MSPEQAKRVAEIAKRETEYPTMRAQADQESIEFLLALVRKLDAERDRLAAIVAKLPTTADGVPAVPGMVVWVVRLPDEDRRIEKDRLVLAIEELDWYDPAEDAYSTRAAALAAAGEPARRGTGE